MVTFQGMWFPKFPTFPHDTFHAFNKAFWNGNVFFFSTLDYMLDLNWYLFRMGSIPYRLANKIKPLKSLYFVIISTGSINPNSVEVFQRRWCEGPKPERYFQICYRAPTWARSLDLPRAKRSPSAASHDSQLLLCSKCI